LIGGGTTALREKLHGGSKALKTVSPTSGPGTLNEVIKVRKKLKNTTYCF